MTERHRVCVDVHVILRRGDHLLLGQRRNTAYGDGCWHPPSGHVEDGEPATVAAVRETADETGVVVNPAGLRLVHLMHHHTDQTRVALFFEASIWVGQPTNLERDKCAGWQWFPLAEPPTEMIDYAAEALRHYREGAVYAERGWDRP